MSDKKYVHTVYATGFAIKVNPSDRVVDVLHSMITGSDTGLCGRSLDGVEVEVIDRTDANKPLEEKK